jgi:hypothetical protein
MRLLHTEESIHAAIRDQDISTLALALQSQDYMKEVRDRLLLTAVQTQSVQAVALVLQEGTSKPGRMEAAHSLTHKTPWSLPMAEIAVILYEEGIDNANEALPFFCKGPIKEGIGRFIEERYRPHTENPPVWSEIEKFIHQDHALADLHEKMLQTLRIHSSTKHDLSPAVSELDHRVHFDDQHPLYCSFTKFIEATDQRFGLSGVTHIIPLRDTLCRNNGLSAVQPARA